MKLFSKREVPDAIVNVTEGSGSTPEQDTVGPAVASALGGNAVDNASGFELFFSRIQSSIGQELSPGVKKVFKTYYDKNPQQNKGVIYMEMRRALGNSTDSDEIEAAKIAKRLSEELRRHRDTYSGW